MELPPYSPDMTPQDFWVISKKRKYALRGRRFQDIGIETYSTTGVPNVSSSGHCWYKGIAAQGEYFESDPPPQ